MGLPIWENENLLDQRTVKRTFFERWFTLPWRPFRPTYTMQLPSTRIYKMQLPQPIGQWQVGEPLSRTILMCHPIMAQRIRDAVALDPRQYAEILDRAVGTDLNIGRDARRANERAEK